MPFGELEWMLVSLGETLVCLKVSHSLEGRRHAILVGCVPPPSNHSLHQPFQ